MSALPRLFFIGVGNMGNPMAANLLKAGYPLTVHDQGEACGARVDVRHTLTLDAATQTYRVPDALRRELPCAPASP